MSDVTNNESASGFPLQGAEGASSTPLGAGRLDMHYGAHPLIFQKAEELRNRTTPSEEILWNFLRKNNLGYKFRRQHPLLMYVADFYCHHLRLIIEIDGSIHNIEDVKRNDAIRQKNLEECGIKVIRFSNHDILHNLENVLHQIQQTLQHGSTSK